MTVVLHDATTIRLVGACGADDADVLLGHLLANPAARVDWRDCETAHAAVIQMLMVAERPLLGPPAGSLLRRIIAPALTHTMGNA